MDKMERMMTDREIDTTTTASMLVAVVTFPLTNESPGDVRRTSMVLDLYHKFFSYIRVDLKVICLLVRVDVNLNVYTELPCQPGYSSDET